jgi:uncharacterized membrane protein YfcA
MEDGILITDPWFYAVAIPAVLLFGISKGGFGGGLGTAAVPLMALVISPVQAAAILLPILCVMDLVALWKFRGKWLWPELKVLLPASLVGILVGTLLFEYMSAAIVRLIVGCVAIGFTLHYWFNRRQMAESAADYYPRSYGVAGGAVAGFTSFVAHSGGPPISMYLLRRPLDRMDFAATTVLFFAVVNYVKLIPYAWLGQLSADNLATSAALVVLAPVGVLIGAWLHARISDRFFFALVYVLLFAVGLKLVFDGVSAYV